MFHTREFTVVYSERLGREVVGLARTAPIDAPWLDIDRYDDVEIDGQLLRFWALQTDASSNGIDMRHVTDYDRDVIKTFADRHTQELYATGKSKRFPPDIAKRAARKLEYIDLATRLDD